MDFKTLMIGTFLASMCALIMFTAASDFAKNNDYGTKPDIDEHIQVFDKANEMTDYATNITAGMKKATALENRNILDIPDIVGGITQAGANTISIILNIPGMQIAMINDAGEVLHVPGYIIAGFYFIVIIIVIAVFAGIVFKWVF